MCDHEWRRIETAPYGKIVLLWAAIPGEYIGGKQNWRMATGHRPFDGTLDWTWDGHPVMPWSLRPTHWMPLPEPPQIPRQDEEARSADEPSQQVETPA